MTNLLLILGIIVLLVFLMTCGIFLLIRSARNTIRPCYRCGGVAAVEYMSLNYCRICRDVIVKMLPVVGLGGMFGFPGAPGYLKFPDFGKKEG